MDTQEALKSAETLLTGYTSTRPEEKRLDVTLAPENLSAVVSNLVTTRWGYLIAITGLDQLTLDQLELLYHFGAGAAVLTLRISLPRTPIPSVDSICPIIPYANVYERELGEMFGVEFRNSPNTDRLFLPDDWCSDVYPLRKDAVLNEE